MLPDMLDAEACGISLIVEEIPVEYDETLKRLSKLKDEHNPTLMIHVGVSHKAKNITLESCASKHGYDRPDVQGKIPTGKECCIGTEKQFKTNLAIEKLVDDLNTLNIGVDFCTSCDAGLYLCEFSYYTSLCLNEQNSLFVHVPDIGKPYLPKETAQGLCEIIRLAVAQINCTTRGENNAI